MSATLLDPAPLAALPAAAPLVAGRPTRTRWTGRALTGAAALFLAFDLALKLVGSPQAVAATVGLGFAPHHLPVLGLIQLGCLALYLIPRTAPLGAVLWTGYLGGAVATHVRLDQPLFTHVLFPTYVAAVVWGGLYLRDARVRALLRVPR